MHDLCETKLKVLSECLVKILDISTAKDQERLGWESRCSSIRRLAGRETLVLDLVVHHSHHVIVIIIVTGWHLSHLFLLDGGFQIPGLL